MAFFDNLEKTLSKNQSAVQKTKKMTDISGINSLVSDEKSESPITIQSENDMLQCTKKF